MSAHPVVQDYPSETFTRLNALAAELGAHGWTATVQSRRGGPPTLHAQNPVREARALSEHIGARPDAGGAWAYWWPWAEVIAYDPGQAAAIIVRALCPAGHTLTKPAGRSPGRATTSDPGPAGMQAALRDAEQFLLRTGSIHPDLTSQTLLRCLRRYRAHLYAVVTAGR
ncbi:MAG TPA: hypothetical protein VGM14_04870 [Streptosporangiaceae bacterium]|jgi:hypothetical protein